MIWTILSIISFFIFIMLMLNIFRHEKRLKAAFHVNLSTSKYIENEVLIEKPLAGHKNKVYKNMNPRSNHVLDKFMLSKEHKDTYLICHFTMPLDEAHVLCIKAYDQTRTLKHTIYVSYPEPIEQTTFIKLPEETAFVNMDISEHKDQIGVIQSFKNERLKAYRKLIRRESLTLLFLLIPLGYLLLSQLTKDELSIYMNELTITLGAALMLGIVIANYVLMLLFVKAKNKDGGKVYEHVQSHL